MKNFKSYLTKRHQKRGELMDTFRVIGGNQEPLEDATTEALKRVVVSRHVSEEMRDMVEKHFGPEAISQNLDPRSRR